MSKYCVTANLGILEIHPTQRHKIISLTHQEKVYILNQKASSYVLIARVKMLAS